MRKKKSQFVSEQFAKRFKSKQQIDRTRKNHCDCAVGCMVIAVVFFTIIVCYPMIFNPQQRSGIETPQTPSQPVEAVAHH